MEVTANREREKKVGITKSEEEGARKTEGEKYSKRTFSKKESKSEK